MKFWRRYFQNVGTVLSQSINAVVLFGDPDESVSARSYRRGTRDNVTSWYLLGKFINLLYFLQEDHVKASYDSDVARSKHIYLSSLMR